MHLVGEVFGLDFLTSGGIWRPDDALGVLQKNCTWFHVNVGH